MNKKTVIVLAALVLTACLIVVLLLIPKKPKENKEKTGGTARIEEETVDIPVEPEELHIELSLSANMGADEIICGFPLVFTATLRNLSAAEASRLEHLIAYYSEKVPPEEKQSAADSIRFWKARLAGLPAAPVLLSREGLPIDDWIIFESLSDGQFIPLPWPRRPLQQDRAARLELGKNKVHLEYLVPEEATVDIAPGAYEVRARLRSGLSETIKGETASGVVPIKLLSPKEADGKTLLRNQYIAGSLHLRHANYSLAEAYAQKIVSLEPERIDALILLGQAKEGRGDTEEAEQIYTQALNLFAKKYPNDPPPVILIQKTRGALLNKIETAKDDLP
jgi:tetratricopeptide (TPR) repeat protein